MKLLKTLFYSPAFVLDTVVRPWRVRRWYRQIIASVPEGEAITWDEFGYRLAPKLVGLYGFHSVLQTTTLRAELALAKRDIKDMQVCSGVARWLGENIPVKV